jgi:DNA-binding transcriptional LysR family regulator
MQLDVHRLLVLRAVRRTGSVAGAATVLHLTASGISQHLSRLEAETGLHLVDRSRTGGGRAVRLTAAGLALAESADRVAHALADAERDVHRLRDGSHGAVRVGGFATALSQLAVPVTMALSISDPGLQTEFMEVDEAEGLDRLRVGDLDLLLNSRDADAPGLRADLVEEDLCLDHYRIVVPDLWPGGRGLEQLLAGPWVTAPPDHPTSRILERLSGEVDVAVGVRHVCIESRTRLALVAAGIGAAVIPDLTLVALSATAVRIHPTPVDLGSRMLTVIRAADRPVPPAASRFTQHLRHVAGGPWTPGARPATVGP